MISGFPISDSAEKTLEIRQRKMRTLSKHRTRRSDLPVEARSDICQKVRKKREGEKERGKDVAAYRPAADVLASKRRERAAT